MFHVKHVREGALTCSQVRYGLEHPAMSVARTVRAELEAAGVTQERVGIALHIAQPGISRRFRGATPWRADELVALSECFDIPLAALYGRPASRHAS